jgi:hypothetical protein
MLKYSIKHYLQIQNNFCPGIGTTIKLCLRRTCLWSISSSLTSKLVSCFITFQESLFVCYPLDKKGSITNKIKMRLRNVIRWHITRKFMLLNDIPPKIFPLITNILMIYFLYLPTGRQVVVSTIRFLIL